MLQYLVESCCNFYKELQKIMQNKISSVDIRIVTY